jgi:hypothetical protein
MDRSGVTRARSRAAKVVAVAACLPIGAMAFASAAHAHVKWFVTCEPSENPIPLQAVLTERFWLFSALFIALFYVACQAEQTAIGALLTKLLDRATAFLRERMDFLLRAVAAVSFSLLWVDGSVVLTPELKGNSLSLSAIQVLIPIFLVARATLPAAAAGIIVLYGCGVASYGLFHMLDYPVFLGLAVYFALSVTPNPKVRALRANCLRWSVALSLLWPAMEKFLYPGWITPIALAHPELTLGLDIATVTTAAGVVEFGLAFAMFWTPLVRRLGALALALLLFAATFDFGKMDAVGHLMVIAVLLSVVADPGQEAARCRPALAPVVSGTALLASIFLYAGIHTLYYGPSHAALVPITSGTALLSVIAFYLSGALHTLLQLGQRPAHLDVLAHHALMVQTQPEGFVMSRRGVPVS